MFRVCSIGEGLGDCFLIEVGNEHEVIRILVDGRDGRQISEIESMLFPVGEKSTEINILIVTHIDHDHINGAIELMRRNPEKFKSTIIIYNYVTKEVISYSQAEKFENIIKDHVVYSTSRKCYPKILQGKMRLLSMHKRTNFHEQIDEIQKKIPVITFLSPDRNGIDSVYEEYKMKRPQNKSGSSVKINKNSIVFLLEYEDKCVLFTGDAYLQNIDRILAESKVMNEKKFDIIKMPHHGAERNNKGIADFAKKHECIRFIVTGECDWQGKKHPDEEILNDIKKKIENCIIYTKVNIQYDVIDDNIKKNEDIMV